MVVNEPMVALCCQSSAPSDGGGTLWPRGVQPHLDPVTVPGVGLGTRAVVLFSVPSDAFQWTVAR
ncbi:hypothetical protein SVIOM342S_10569 [Streptomyces violaceorubidus]